MTARIYECRITHARVAPLRNVFRYPTYLWLVDLDHLPRFGPLGPSGFRARTTSATRAGASGRTSTASWPSAASTAPAR